MMNRSLIVLTVALSLLTAGCLGGNAGDQPAAFVPSPMPADLAPAQEPEPTQVPEPFTAGLLTAGVAMAFVLRRKAARPL
jgi:hypothetical protein